jgi:hypothetical protein
MTKAERALWSSLRDRQLADHKFRRQAPIGSFIVDFACLAAKLVIERDGSIRARLRAWTFSGPARPPQQPVGEIVRLNSVPSSR